MTSYISLEAIYVSSSASMHPQIRVCNTLEMGEREMDSMPVAMQCQQQQVVDVFAMDGDVNRKELSMSWCAVPHIRLGTWGVWMSWIELVEENMQREAPHVGIGKCATDLSLVLGSLPPSRYGDSYPYQLTLASAQPRPASAQPTLASAQPRLASAQPRPLRLSRDPFGSADPCFIS